MVGTANAATATIPISKKINVKAGRGGVMGVVREQYLRTDVPCRSKLCFEGCSNDGGQGGKLPADVTHYLLPLEDVVRNYFEVLESEKLAGVIYLQSVVAPVQMASQRHYKRICGQVREPKRGAVFFPNEFCKSTYVRRRKDESLTEHRARMAHKVAEWYYEHLGGQKPIVVVTEDKELIAKYESKRIEIFVVSLGEYLDKFWSGVDSMRELYGGIRAALDAAAGATTKSDGVDFEEYLKTEVLESGIKKGRFVQGKLHVNKHHATKEAFVVRQGGDADRKGFDSSDILICGSTHRNRAVHGDVVVCQLLPKSQWRSRLNRLAEKKKEESGGGGEKDEEWERRADVCPTGKVVGVLQRNWREYVATIPKEEADEEALHRRGGRRVLAIPYDYRIPKVRVLTAQVARLAGQRIVVSIDGWPTGSRYPNGHFVRALGRAGDLETGSDGILLENDISVTPFSQGILKEMPLGDGWKPEEEEVARRRDLRESHAVMSIDPVGCEDVDDALSVKPLDNGNLELGVHIADVTHFVPFNSLTDLEARSRATTVYLADRRYDMLPSVLSANVCSLLGGVDRYAVSVLWQLEPDTYKVLDVWYGRTVIRSSYKLCYEAAQDIIEGKTAREMQEQVLELQGYSGQGLEKKFKKLKETLVQLSAVARGIQDEREKRGALRLDGAEVRFEFEAANLTEMRPKEHLRIHETVAECMIFANHWVAKKIAETFPLFSLLRRHQPPKAENFEELKVCAAARGWHVDTGSSQALAKSLDRCVDVHDPNVNLLLRQLATHAMVQALYFSTGSVAQDEWRHYGLALDQYTHFTSPIRRYADVVVHRLLMAAVKEHDWWADSDKGGAGKDHKMLGNAALSELSLHINDRNRAAQQAQRASQILFQTLFFKNKEPDDPRCVVDAVIFSVRANGFLVYVPRYALKGPVYMVQEDKEEVLYYKANFGPVWTKGKVKQDVNSLTVEIDGGKKRQVYRLFDHITITIQMRQGGESHPRSLAFFFLSNRGHSDKATALDKGQVNFLREIRSELRDDGEGCDDDANVSEEAGRADGVDRQDCSNDNGGKMYKFFQDMKTLGIRELK